MSRKTQSSLPPKGIYDGAHHYTEWKEPWRSSHPAPLAHGETEAHRERLAHGHTRHQYRLLIIPSAPYIAVASFGPGKGLNVVGDPAPVRQRTEKGQEEGLGDSIQGVTELPLF